MTTKKLLIAALLVASCGYSRLVKTWTHNELAAASDTIAIIQAVSTEKTELPLPEGFPEEPENYQAWITTFKILVGLKGDLNQEKPLQIVHFTYSDRKNVILNGAEFMRFTIGPVNREVSFKYDGDGRGKVTEYKYFPVWLAYLKHREDGRYEPTAGHYDAAPSFKELSDHRLP